MEIIKDLFVKRTPFEEIAKAAIENEHILNELLDGISPKNKNHDLRFACHKSLMVLIELNAKILYKYWDFFTELLKSKNAFHILNAVYILTSLISVDKEHRFEEIYDSYFAQLYNPKVSVAAHVARNAALIVKYNPDLESSVTQKLLDYQFVADNYKNGELVKAYIIEAFSEYYSYSENKDNIIQFVKYQLNSSSPKTKKLAKNFIKSLS